ncbi:protein kinase domain-containing protein [Brasilonema octagenarum]|uniref:non-specific serine/threonine protein kinase n=1 Tax=Brasilonema octagenarum UFV-OR1 TaxID=417115 RepID=A0ABX1M4C8_9CYAN|nr:protein kinase [Brasilonema octagenarum]NMF63379.1 serine/threonine protein kinase [Brasilonema octagenarum UFV-OR1]
MPAKVTLTITEGKSPGRQYTFDSRTTCIIGRAKDCNPQLPDDDDHLTISRYHCLLDINPPNIRVRDFGSRNGTYVNGKKIGQRQSKQTPEEAAKLELTEYDLQDGDEIKLGNTVFVVGIEVELQSLNIPDFVPGTANIHNVNQRPTQAPFFLELIKRLLGLAEKGDENLIAIRGYSIIKLLGKGGCGEAYLAQHNQTKNFVALKVMLPAVAANEWAVQMFMRETENTKALRHPNVVKLLDYGYSESIFFFTMEYCEGGTVADLIERQGGKLSIDIAVPITLQVLDGLEYTHNAEIPNVKLGNGGFGKGRGLVHRDLKPSNIFLGNVDGKLTVKIGDYGLSKAFDLAGLSGQTFTGFRAGTPVLICRQQLLNYKHVKPEVDVWAAAGCLYYMLTGFYPRNFTDKDLWKAILEDDSVPIRQRDANIPQRLAEVIDLALVEKPEIYFKSATQFKQALLDVL